MQLLQFPAKSAIVATTLWKQSIPHQNWLLCFLLSFCQHDTETRLYLIFGEQYCKMKGMNAKKRRETNLRGITIWSVHSVESCKIFYHWYSTWKHFWCNCLSNDINSIISRKIWMAENSEISTLWYSQLCFPSLYTVP